MIYLKLLFSFMQIGLFSIGGGYAAIPLIQHQAVAVHHWLSMGEFTDLITIAEMTPGPIAVNSATFVGTRIAGPGGALAATLGCILPSCLIVSLLAYLYFKYQKLSLLQHVLASLRPAVVALIASAGLSILQLVLFQGAVMGLNTIHWLGAGLFVLSLVLLRKWKLSPILTMGICGLISLGANFLFGVG